MKRLLSFIIFLLVFSIAVFASDDGRERPKIGLVLSGGGAKGLAHIGVIKVLEEAGIKPDFITGTSMGSIIGGLYAIGYSAAELDSFARDMNWVELFSDVVPLRNIIPEEKNDYGRFNLEFDISRGGLKIPGGLIAGNSVNVLFGRLTLPTSGIHSFDDFPIPFRCVASDLITGEQVVFKEGDLATAMRASMSIPTVFTPVILNDAVLVDGGVLNNFPVLICKEMGADIIIGVNVGNADNMKKEDFASPLNVIMSSAMIGSNIGTVEAKKHVDLLVEPDLQNYSVGSFSNSAEIIDLGEKAAREMQQIINDFACRLDSLGVPKYEPIDKGPSEYKINQIRVKGLNRISFRFFTANLGIEQGSTITPNILDDRVNQLMGTRYFKSVTYRLAPLKDGYMLNMEVVEAEQMRFKFSMHYDNFYKASVTANLTFRNILARGNRLSLTMDISEKPRLNGSMFSYIGERQRMAITLGMNVENNFFPFYLPDGSGAGTLNNDFFNLTGGFMFSPDTKWELNLFTAFERSTLKQNSGLNYIFTNGVNRFGNSFGYESFKASRNTLDKRFFPTSGSLLNLDARLYFSINEFYSGRRAGHSSIEGDIYVPYNSLFSTHIDFEKYFDLSRRINLSVRVLGGFSSHPMPMTGHRFIGGIPSTSRSGDVPFIGLAPRERATDNYAIARTNFRYRFMKSLYVTGVVNALYSSHEPLSKATSLEIHNEDFLLGYGIMAEYGTLFGPIQFGIGKNSANKALRGYFSLGYMF